VNRIAVNKLASDKLVSSRLSDGTLQLNSTTAGDLLATDDGREVLAYVISCALPATTTLTAPDGTLFTGAIGVAPQWLDKQLDLNGQLWESACMFSRVNANDVAVPISIRGLSSALAPTAEEVTDWTIQEGAFYGQYFTPENDPILWIACQGTDVAGAVAAERDCAAPDPDNPGYTLCGFIDAGACRAPQTSHHWWWQQTPSACQFYIDDGGADFYAGCFDPGQSRPFGRNEAGGGQGHDQGNGQPWFWSGDHWQDRGWAGAGDGDGNAPAIFFQVITTYVHP
jgi:hypothetical protein